MTSTSKTQIAQALRLLADALETDKEAAPSKDELLDASQALERYGMGRAALDARATPKAKVGRAWKWRVSDIEAAIQAVPGQPRPPRLRRIEASAVIEDPIDAMVRRGELRAVRGGRTVSVTALEQSPDSGVLIRVPR